MAMRRALEWGLLLVGALALGFVALTIARQLAAAGQGGAPVRVVRVDSAPYPLVVRLYRDPAIAGYALPFSVAPQAPTSDHLSYSAASVPGDGVDATEVHASLGPDPAVPNGARGTAEITVRGPWTLTILVRGPAGIGAAYVPIRAEVAGWLPPTLGWPIGLAPVVAMVAFLLVRARRPVQVVVDRGGGARP
jgi:hypothetical protein